MAKIDVTRRGEWPRRNKKEDWKETGIEEMRASVLVNSGVVLNMGRG